MKNRTDRTLRLPITNQCNLPHNAMSETYQQRCIRARVGWRDDQNVKLLVTQLLAQIVARPTRANNNYSFSVLCHVGLAKSDEVSRERNCRPKQLKSTRKPVPKTSVGTNRRQKMRATACFGWLDILPVALFYEKQHAEDAREYL